MKTSRRPQEEAKLWQSMKRQIPDHLLAYRVEVKSPPGMSDVYWTRRGGTTFHGPPTGWIELKSQVTVIEPEQRLFLRSMRLHNVSAWILSEYGEHVHLIDPLLIDYDLKIPYDKSIFRLPRKERTLWSSIWKNVAGVPW